MDVALCYNIAQVTEAAAIKASHLRGMGDKIQADDAATQAMRNVLNSLPVSATVVIGEGEMDEAPMLYIGEKLGKGGIELDIAVDPLDGTTLASKNRENAIAVIAVSSKGALLHAPDMYMLKMGVGPGAKGAIDLNLSFTENLKNISKALEKPAEQINVVMLDRDRHAEYIKEARAFGAKVTLIPDGDVSPIIGCGIEGIDMDVMFGIGGAPEGVVAAAAAKCLGGDFQGKLWVEDNKELERCKEMGIEDVSKVYALDELVKSDEVIFSLTGITRGFLCDEVQLDGNEAMTSTMLLNSIDKTIRKIETIHKI